MKSYSVKSNAKRYARRLAELNSYVAIEVIEPVLEDEEGGPWLPAIRIPADTPLDLKKRLHNAANETAVIHGLAEAFNDVDGDAGVYAVPAEDMSELADGVDVSHMVGGGDVVSVDLPYAEQGDMVERLLSEGLTVAAPDHTGAIILHEPEYTVEVGDEAEADSPLTPAEAKAVVDALATLPPPVKRTPEEIAKARQERRARIDAGEYKAPAPAAIKESKAPTKSELVLNAIKVEGGASVDDLIAITDWQRHTLRGYIAGALRARAAKEGLEIEAFKVKGQPTRYRALPA